MDNKENRNPVPPKEEKNKFEETFSSLFSSILGEDRDEPSLEKEAEDSRNPAGTEAGDSTDPERTPAEEATSEEAISEETAFPEAKIPDDLYSVIMSSSAWNKDKLLEDESLDPEDFFDYPDAPEDDDPYPISLPKEIREDFGSEKSNIEEALEELKNEGLAKPEGDNLPVEVKEEIDLMIEESRGLPNSIGKRIGLQGMFPWIYAALVSMLGVLLIISVFITNAIVEVYELSLPKNVASEYVKYLTGNNLYNDIASRIKDTHTEFESEVRAAQAAMEKLSMEDGKNYYEVSRSENGILYDVYSGDTHLYSLTLSKKGEIAPFGFDLWKVDSAAFIESSIGATAKTFTFSAPYEAEIYVNGIRLSPDYITDENYRFFVGSIWESEIPAEARCVQYTVKNLYSEPEVKAYLSGEELFIYRDEGKDDFHAKYPSSWVNDYTVELPKGASLHINGVLATAVSANGKSEDTLFQQGLEGMTDIYVIEGLFKSPKIEASYNGIPLGEPKIDGTYYRYGYTKEMFLSLSVTVPEGATVTVNGVTLTETNSSSAPIPFSVWSSYPTVLSQYMPTNLKNSTGVQMPNFVTYSVSELYSSPEVKVFLGSLECREIVKERNSKENSEYLAFDFPEGAEQTDVESFAKQFAAVYMKYITEGCYGIRDNVEIRKNFYNNWKTYLSYIVPDSLCYTNARDSYTDVEYRPSHKLESETYKIEDLVRYSDDIFILKIVAVTKDNEDKAPVESVINAVIVRIGGEYKIWMHNELAA